MTSRIRNVGVAAAFGMFLLFLVLRSGSGGVERTVARPPAPPMAEQVPATDAERLSAPAATTTVDWLRGSVSYAVPTTELRGLPPSAAPGTRLDIWVAWEPPITKVPDIRLLLKAVTLDKIAPPVLPEGPHVALLLVERRQVRDLLYGHRYGALSVTLTPR